MLTENEENVRARTPRARKPGRWDAVMSKIEQNKAVARSGSRSGPGRTRVTAAASPTPAPGSRHPLRDLGLGSRCGSATRENSLQVATSR